MCGIAGFYGHGEFQSAHVNRVLEKMVSRGPNAQTYARYSTINSQLHFFHSRLSIIDLEERSNQPFRIGEFSIIYNGELYNYKEIRECLQKEGVVFCTNSDTEVLLAAYVRWGTKALDLFEGMWSFAIYNHYSGEVFLSRDRFGEKPLFLYENEKGIYFASEVKLIAEMIYPSRLRVNQKQVLRFLVNGYKSLYKTGETFFEGVSELPAGSFLIIDGEHKRNAGRYWNISFRPTNMTTEEAVNGIRVRLLESLKIRLRSDVPIAFCLSGGIDSGALVSLAAKCFRYPVSTFTILDSDPRYNEEQLARTTIADVGCKSHFVKLSPSNDLDRLQQLTDYHDSPICTISYYVHSFLSEAIGEKGFRVAFSGTGADELFTGYYDHFNLHLAEMAGTDGFAESLKNWTEGVGNYVRNPFLRDPELFLKKPSERGHIYLKNDVYSEMLKTAFSEDFFEEKFCNSNLRNRMLNELFHETVPPLLHEDDLNSMMYSIENRSPFLDRQLFEFTMRIPSDLLIQNGYSKFLLREAVKGELNDSSRLCRQKKGFNASVASVFNLDSKSLRDEVLSPGPIYELVKKEAIEDLLVAAEFPNSDSKFLFSFLTTMAFLKKWS